jgi:hypothetical protein
MATVISDLRIGQNGLYVLATDSTVGGANNDGKRLSVQADGTDPAEIEILPGPSNTSGMNSQIMLMGKVGDDYERFSISEISSSTPNSGSTVIDSTANHQGNIRPIVFVMGTRETSGTVASPGPPRAGMTAMTLTADASVRLQGSTKTIAATGSEAGGSYGSERTTIWDFADTGTSRLIIDTRQPAPTSNTADDSGVEYWRGGARCWLVGLNSSGAGLDSFDWYSTKTGSVGGKMSLSQSGYLGLGVNLNPAYPLHVDRSISSDAVGLIRNGATDGYGLVLRNGNDSHYCLSIQNAAGTDNKIQLFGDGTITCTTVSTPSDRSLKKNVQPLGNTLEKVRELRAVSFEWAEDKNPSAMNDSRKRQLGVIGQEVEQVFPELVSTNADGIYSVDYSKLCVVLLEAVKDLDRQISELAA